MIKWDPSASGQGRWVGEWGRFLLLNTNKQRHKQRGWPSHSSDRKTRSVQNMRNLPKNPGRNTGVRGISECHQQGFDSYCTALSRSQYEFIFHLTHLFASAAQPPERQTHGSASGRGNGAALDLNGTAQGSCPVWTAAAAHQPSPSVHK